MRGIVLTITLAGGEPPTEFQIFAAGVNKTRKGAFIFDAKAAELVMAAYEEHATLGMIDLEHLSLDDTHPNFDPDARGWFRLEVRDGALWAVGVTWTPDGAARLKARTQIYFSPAFDTDEEGRITRLFNIAITALPATDGLRPLMAASGRKRNKPMLTMLTAIVAASAICAMPAEEIVELVYDEGEGAGEVAGVNIGELAAFLGVDVDPAQDPAGFVAALRAKLQEVEAKLSGSAAAAPSEGEGGEPSPEMAAASQAATAIMRLTDTKSAADATRVVEQWRKLAIDHTATLKRLEDERKKIEASKYHALTARLVVCGAELPATAWQDDAKTKPAKHLLAMSLEDLEKRAQAFEAKGGGKVGGPLVPKLDSHGLDERELKICREMNCKPEVFAARKYPNGRTA